MFVCWFVVTSGEILLTICSQNCNYINSSEQQEQKKRRLWTEKSTALNLCTLSFMWRENVWNQFSLLLAMVMVMALLSLRCDFGTLFSLSLYATLRYCMTKKCWLSWNVWEPQNVNRVHYSHPSLIQKFFWLDFARTANVFYSILKLVRPFLCLSFSFFFSIFIWSVSLWTSHLASHFENGALWFDKSDLLVTSNWKCDLRLRLYTFCLIYLSPCARALLLPLYLSLYGNCHLSFFFQQGE